MKTIRRVIAWGLALCMILSAGGVQVFADSILALPSSVKQIEAEAFCGDESLDMVILPEGLETIGERAFASSSIQAVNLPSSLTDIADDAFEGAAPQDVNAEAGSYAHSWAVEHGYLPGPLGVPVITSLTQDGSGQVTVHWSAAEGAESYRVYEFTGGRHRLLGETSALLLSVEAVTDGLHRYTVQAGRTRNSGIAEYGEYSQEAAIEVQLIWSYGPELIEAAQTSVNEVTLRWRGVVPADSYELAELVSDEYILCGQVETAVADELTLNGVMEGEHYYVVRAVFNDGNRDWVSAWSAASCVNILDAAAYAPEAPDILLADGTMAFASHEASAPDYPQETLELFWEKNIYAAGYTLLLERRNAEGYEPVWEQEFTSETSLVLPKSLFGEISERTLFRFGIAAQGAATGDTVFGYFAIQPSDLSITVDGLTDARWERPSTYAASRSFTVHSDLPWTAESSADWLRVTASEDELVLSVTDNPAGSSRMKRTGIVTLTNGEQNATVTVVQSNHRTAPVLEWCGAALSTDSAAPTLIPAGGMTLEWSGGDNLLVRIYEKTDDSYGVWRHAYRTSASPLCLLPSSDTYSFSAGKEVCLEASWHISSDMNLYSLYETEGDTHTQRYYIRFTDSGHFIYLNGLENTSLKTENGGKVALVASNICQLQSDAAWLSGEIINDNTQVRVICAENSSGAARVGHLTVSCGQATGTITVTQDTPTTKPAVLSPAGLSQSENTPSAMGAAPFFYSVTECSYSWEYKNGNSWVTDHTGSTSGGEKWFYFSNTNLHRLTLTDEDGGTAVYYMKPSAATSDSKYITINTRKHLRVEHPAAASSVSLTVKASDSWTASSDSSWLSVSPASGSSGSMSATLVTALNTGAERTGTISFKFGSAVYAKLVVTQSAMGSDTVSVLLDDTPAGFNRGLEHVNGSQTSLRFDVDTSIELYQNGPTFQVTPNADWMSVSSTDTYHRVQTVTLSANNTGTPRTGSVTFQFGGSSRTISITQEPKLSAVMLMTPELSTSSSSPTALSYDGDGMTLVWPQTANAIRYRAILKYMDAASTTQYTYYQENEGGTNCIFTLPASVFDAGYAGRYRLALSAIDTYGNIGPVTYGYFSRTLNGAVFVDGKPDAVWDNADDRACSYTCTIAADGNWTASASADWIGLSSVSGASGEKLTLNLAANNGARRSGTVTVSCDAASATISVTQCAMLTDFPRLGSPQLSDDVSAPTVLDKTDMLTFTWPVEPQADFYKLRIVSCPQNSAYTIGSGALHLSTYASAWSGGTASYTLDVSGLDEGVTYNVQLFRAASDGTKASYYYFTFQVDEPYLELQGERTSAVDDETLEFYAEGGEDNAYYHISSSGTWVAAVSDPSWMMLYKTPITSAMLTDDETESSMYNQFVGASGGALCVSLLANNTGNTRQGTVTVTCGGLMKSFTVTQEQQYELPYLTTPTLATRPGETTERTLESMNLSWTSGDGNTGRYSLTLSEKDGSHYYTIWSLEDTRSRNASIPASVFAENTHYRLQLSTTLENSGTEDGTSYYFHIGSANTLHVTADVDWSQVNAGGYVSVTTTASGGSGAYQYAYQLLVDGVIEQSTDWGMPRYYQFKPQGSGDYTLKVFVQDSTGATSNCFSSFERASTSTISIVSAGFYAADLNSKRQTLDYTIIANGDWTLNNCPNWITPSSSSGSSGTALRFVIDSNDAYSRRAELRFISGNDSSTLSIVQAGIKQLALTDMDGRYSCADQYAEFTLEATTSWTALCNESWVEVLNQSGTPGQHTISFRLAENPGSAREAVITVTTTGDVERFSVTQLSSSDVLFLSTVNWPLASFAAEALELTVTSDVPWAIESKPDWLHVSETEGYGSASLSLYVGATEEARSGDLVISGGESRAVLSISQPAPLPPAVVSFTSDYQTVSTGKAVRFEVEVQGSSKVQLYVDGVGYDTAPVIDGHAVLERAFYQKGERRIQFKPLRGSTVGWLSSTRILTVTSNDLPLDAPQPFTDSTCYVGTPLVLYWQAIPNAQQYTIQFTDGEETIPLGKTEETHFEIKGRYFDSVDTFRVQVIATAPGYSQSAGIIELNAIARTVDFSMRLPHDNDPFETHDKVYFSASNPSYYPLRFFVCRYENNSLKESFYWPKEGCVIGYNPTVEYCPDLPGSYTVKAMAYASVYELDPERYWGSSKEEVRFTVTAGAIVKNSAVVGSEETVQDGSAINRVALRTTMNVETVDVYDGDTLMVTLNASSDSTPDTTNYCRIYRYDSLRGLAEGEHSIRFVSTDLDEIKDVETVELYAYTPLNMTRYPDSKSVYLREMPSYSTGKLLSLSDELQVLGSYGSDYYVSVGGEKGFVNKDQTVEEMIIDWGEYSLQVTQWPGGVSFFATGCNKLFLTPQDYTISFGWTLNRPLPANYGYNVYLCCDPGMVEDTGIPYSIWKLNSHPLGADRLSVDTADLKKIMKQVRLNGWKHDLEVWLRVDVVELSTGNIKLQTLNDEQSLFLAGEDDWQKVESWLKTLDMHTIAFHDAICRGWYVGPDGSMQKGYSYMYAIQLSKLYDFGVGNWSDFKQFPATRGGLIAESVMRSVSANNADNADGRVRIEEFEELLSNVGFFTDFLVEFSRFFASKSASAYISTGDAEDLKLFAESMKDQMLMEDIEQAFSVVKDTVTLGNMLTNMLYDYIDYSTVTQAEVQDYIDAFQASDDVALNCAADFLTMMTKDRPSLGLYLGLAYGGSWAKDKLMEETYKFIIKNVDTIVPGFGLMTTGVQLVGNMGFNAKNTFAAGYELQVLSDASDEARDAYMDACVDFYLDPVANYLDYQTKRNDFLALHRLEVDKLIALIKQLDSGAVTDLIMGVASALGADFETEEDFNDAYESCAHKYYDSAWETYYAVRIKRHI